MSKRTPATSGSEWLYHSMNAFNGSGYADKSSPEKYIESYIYYNAWKKRGEAIELVKRFRVEANTFAEKLVGAREAGHEPSKKNIEKFEAFKDRAGLLL